MMSGLTRVQNGNFPILETNELDLVYALTHCQYELLASVAILAVFFFQAEDGIRDIGVTGVQTCALPISSVTLPTVRTSIPAPPRWSIVLFAMTKLSRPVSPSRYIPAALMFQIRLYRMCEIGRASCRERV